MATKIHYLTGTAKWAKFKKPDEKYQNYTIDLYPDEAGWSEFKKTGMGITPKENEEGTFLTLRRPHAKLIKGEMVTFGPPTVFSSNGETFDGLVGNGSKVTVKVVVYDTPKGKGHRLDAVRVDELVEYNPVGAGFPTMAPKPGNNAALPGEPPLNRRDPSRTPAAAQPPF